MAHSTIVDETVLAPSCDPPSDRPHSRAVALAAGGSHTCAVLEDGRVLCWGGNGSGALGIGKSTRDAGWSAVPQQVLDVADAAGVEAGNYYNCAIMRDATVKC